MYAFTFAIGWCLKSIYSSYRNFHHTPSSKTSILPNIGPRRYCGAICNTMALQGSERGQQNEFNASWPQLPQLQLGSYDAVGIFAELGSDPFADNIPKRSNTTTSKANHQYPPTTHYQHLNSANLAGSDYAITDTVVHSLLPPFDSRN